MVHKQRNEHFEALSEAHVHVREILDDTENSSANICYLILCDNTDRTDSEFKADAVSYFDSGNIPSWAWAAHYADHCIYVGATTNLYNRFCQHCFSHERGALFTGLFPPKNLAAVSQFPDHNRVFDAESKMASLAEEGYRERHNIPDNEEVFVYQS